MTEDVELRKRVHENLDNAWENGYFEEGEFLHNAPPEEVMSDMFTYAEDMALERSTDILPLVKEWMIKVGLLNE